MSQTLYFVIARVEDGEIKHYLSREDGPVELDSPNTAVFENEDEADLLASRDHTSNKVLRIHRDFLDVAAIPSSIEQAADSLAEACHGATLAAKAFAEATGDAEMIDAADSLTDEPKRRQDEN